MSSILCYGIAGVFISTFVYFDVYNITKYTVVPKWNRFKKLNRMVSTNYKGFFKILFISLCIIIKAVWVNIIQYMNNTLIKIDKNTYIVTYVINGNIYKMKVKPKRGPSRVLMVTDENNDDISDSIMPYIGPEQDFHNKIYNSVFFNKKEIVFQMSNGDEKIFKDGQDIVL